MVSDKMNRGSCVDCEEQDAYYIDDYKDELCGTCLNKRIKTDKAALKEFLKKENWIKACKYDNIKPDSKFVIFSDDNPYKNYK